MRSKIVLCFLCRFKGRGVHYQEAALPKDTKFYDTASYIAGPSLVHL